MFDAAAAAPFERTHLASQDAAAARVAHSERGKGKGLGEGAAATELGNYFRVRRVLLDLFVSL